MFARGILSPHFPEHAASEDEQSSERKNERLDADFGDQKKQA